MYLAFFGLTEKPFSITPDPRYLYLSARHADALAHLVYGITEAGGFVQLTGEVGTGKTTIIRSLLSRTPQNAEIALILNPRLTPSEFLLSLCEELGMGAANSADGSAKDVVDLLNRYLLRSHAQGRRVVLIVDEAQNLAPEVLEQIRLLTNLETETQKLLQIILIGQPELRKLLAREDLRQLAQRVTGRYHLDPLSRAETAAYVRHRMRVAGATADVFTNGALREVYRISHGIPRVINIVCDRALLGAYTQDLHQVPASLVRRASAEVFDQAIAPGWMPFLIGALALLIVGGTSALFWRNLPGWHRSAPSANTAAVPASTAAPATVPVPLPAPLASVAPVAETPLPAPAASAGATPVGSPRASAPSATSVEPPAGLGQLLATNRSSTDTDTAFRQLLGLWKASYTPGKLDGCTQAASQGLRCLTQRGSLAQLRQLNRPAILMLSDDSGTPYQIVLRQLADTTAQLQLGAQTVTVNLGELTHYWFGDFVLVWHPPSRDVRDLSAGMHGALVRQLRTQLDHWSGAPGTAGATAANDEYDASLVQLVEEFQRACRLQVDGIAGIETQVALDAALAAADSPLLQARPLQQALTRGS